jgi:hypothetical protein
MLAVPEIKPNCPKKKNHPMGENSPNLVTLNYPFHRFLFSLSKRGKDVNLKSTRSRHHILIRSHGRLSIKVGTIEI